MNVGLFALPRYLTVVLLCAAAYAIGRTVLRSIKFTGMAERVSLCTALGLGLIAHLVLLVGICGWLNAPAVIAIIGAATATALVFHYAVPATNRDEAMSRDSSPWSRRTLLLFVGVASLAFLPLALLPL